MVGTDVTSLSFAPRVTASSQQREAQMARRRFRFGASGQGSEAGGEQGPAGLPALARRAESMGYDVFCVPDHLGDQLAPMPALAALAGATERIRLATMVLANDFRHPAVLAKEAATVDILSGGRLELGIGAGWLRGEFDAAGIVFDAPATRIERLAEAVTVLTGLWSGEPLTHLGAHYRIDGLVGSPRPVQRPRPPLVIGGGGPRVLELAARHADVVSVAVRSTRTGRLRAGDLTLGATAARVEHVRRCTGGRDVELNWLVTSVVHTLDRRAVAQAHLDAFAGGHPDIELDIPLTVDDVLASPYLAIGTPQQIADQLLQVRDVTGMSYPAVFPTHAEAFAPVVELLAGR